MKFRPDLISTGFELWKQELTDDEKNKYVRCLKAFKKLKDVINTHTNKHSVPLEKNDMLFMNNQRVLHGRTRFDDPERSVVRIRYNDFE